MGFGGMRDLGESLTFNPRLPDALSRLAFSIRHRGRCLHVEVTTHTATYSLTRGTGTIRITHHGESLTVERSRSSGPFRRPRSGPPPMQPPGREPPHRSVE